MSISFNEVTSGMGLNINGDIYIVLDYQHVKPGKGAAFMKSRIKNVKTQQVLEKTFRASDKLDDVVLEERKLQNLYKSTEGVHFMDLTTYEEIVISEGVLGDEAKFLQDNLQITGTCYNNQVLKINLPTFIETDIISTEPGIKGDSSRSGTKPATIDTGATILVPLFISTADRIKVDTRTGTYVERVKK